MYLTFRSTNQNGCFSIRDIQIKTDNKSQMMKNGACQYRRNLGNINNRKSSGTEKYPIYDAIIRRNNCANNNHADPKTTETEGEGELLLNLGIKWVMPKLKHIKK